MNMIQRRARGTGAMIASAFVVLVAWWYVLMFMWPTYSGFGGVQDRKAEETPRRVKWLKAAAQDEGKRDGRGLFDLHSLFQLGRRDPWELTRLLEEDDPFKVSVDSPERFRCPLVDDRFSEPDMRDHEVEREFRQGGGFVYYQHLRKAGGTGFCEMAGRNMKPSEVPAYFCMPDNRGGLATPPWSKQSYLFDRLAKKGHRIVANEWDAFPGHHLYLPGAVFATTFRHPVDRWYSQYRFEHVEHRDGGKGVPMPFQKWYKLYKNNNYYVKTFCGMENLPDHIVDKDMYGESGKPKHAVNLYWSYDKFSSWGQDVEWQHFKQAVDNLSRFNLLLILDFVSDEMWALEETLGWTQPRKQVLPHEGQAMREDKKSISAKEALHPNVWKDVQQANVFDLLLFHWAKRMYLERSACRHEAGNTPLPAGTRTRT